ncbi:hypothetical protein [Streptomyces mirabilis]|uniref:hypothetical protein n=1 Tax=Streptomyces mirabilis TaxID=68239 RepID=UPI0033A856BE
MAHDQSRWKFPALPYLARVDLQPCGDTGQGGKPVAQVEDAREVGLDVCLLLRRGAAAVGSGPAGDGNAR